MNEQLLPRLALPTRLTIERASSVLTELQASLSVIDDARVVLDAAGMHDFDTSAVAVLLELRRHQMARGRELGVANWPERLTSLVRLYGVDSLLDVSSATAA